MLRTTYYDGGPYAPAYPPQAPQQPAMASHQETKPSPTTLARTNDALVPVSLSQGGRRYRLDVVQQPKRARMCGFGDKDRRPITPPPCIRLVVIDEATGKETDCNEIEHTMFVLNVDLWSEDALREVNLVRHTTTTPSISSTTPASFQTLDSGNMALPAYSNILPSNRESPYASQGYGVAPAQAISPYGAAPAYPHGGGYAPQNGAYGPPQQYYPQHQVGEFRPEIPSMAPMGSQPGMHLQYAGPPRSIYDNSALDLSQRMPVGPNQPQGMFTRNLIGSLAASAFRLTDPQDKIGIWFVLQDLSVRTEGSFRLRFSFVNVGPPPGTANGSSDQSSLVNTGRAPVLASCFSDIFQVYSAKKFPGVCESTPLSKCFATQGIKIPIRKEGAGNSKGGENDDYED